MIIMKRKSWRTPQSVILSYALMDLMLFLLQQTSCFFVNLSIVSSSQSSMDLYQVFWACSINVLTDLLLEMFDLLRFNAAMHWLVGLQVLYFHSIAIDFHFLVRVFNRVNMRHSSESCLSPSGRMNGRCYNRRRIMRLDKLGQTFVVPLVMRLKYKDGHKTHLSIQTNNNPLPFKRDTQRKVILLDRQCILYQSSY